MTDRSGKRVWFVTGAGRGAGVSIANAAQRAFWERQNGQQSGDQAKLAEALVTIAGEAQPPRHFIAGADAIAQAEATLAERQQQISTHRDLSTSLAFDKPGPAGDRGATRARSGHGRRHPNCCIT